MAIGYFLFWHLIIPNRNELLYLFVFMKRGYFQKQKLFLLAGADPGLILGCCKILQKKLKVEMI